MSRTEAPSPMEAANDLMALALRYDRTAHQDVARSARRGAAAIRAIAEVRRPDDLAAVLYFLRGAAEAGATFNSREGQDAFDAAARLFGLDPQFAWEKLG
ncbi:hypothetical protein [Amaricoccus sp.]|uniref:hypothetical protein n=1 Tax=Amaricoccus sp. TaxID=1872485 RepID=UPI001B64F9EF|nr:hypothetical protein [Amaricoccus sp.]MBP7243208.1 hypothetical protein [Amaricoccus sp.]